MTLLISYPAQQPFPELVSAWVSLGVALWQQVKQFVLIPPRAVEVAQKKRQVIFQTLSGGCFTGDGRFGSGVKARGCVQEEGGCRIVKNSDYFDLGVQTISLMKAPLKPLFREITPEVVQAVQSDQRCLQSPCRLNRNSSREARIVLTNSYIALGDPSTSTLQYMFYTPLDYDLKFQPLYELQLTQPPSDSTIYSRVVGFQLQRAGTQPLEVLILGESVAQIWVRLLSRSLNQLGFHRLYKPVKKLGKGGFATVYEVERLTDKRHFAVKAFSKQNTVNSDNQSHRLTLLNEIKVMRALDSPHAIKLQGVFQSDNSLYVILELLSAGQLHSRINRREGEFSLGEIKQFMIGLARGLKEIHDNGIMHRDIKPQNIMLRSEGGLDPVIVDFGLSAFVDAEDYLFYRCGTPGYVAPEITTLVKGQHVDPVCDVFSVGVIFHILLTKRPLFEGRKFEEVYENNRKMRFNLNGLGYKKVDPEAMDLLEKMLKIDPRERIRPDDILRHPFLCGWVMEDEKEELSPTSTLVSCRKQEAY